MKYANEEGFEIELSSGFEEFFFFRTDTLRIGFMFITL